MQAKATFLDDASYAALKSGKVRIRVQFIPFDTAQHNDLAELLKTAEVEIVGSSLAIGDTGPLWMDIAISAAPAPAAPSAEDLDAVEKEKQLAAQSEGPQTIN